MDQDSFFGRMFAFTNRPMPPQPQGPYQTTGLLLRIYGWLALVYFGVLLLFLFLGMLAVVIGAAFFAQIMAALPGPTEWIGELGGLFAVLAAFLMLVVLVVVAVVGGLVLSWLGWTYDHFRQRDPRALGHLFAIGLVLTIIGGLGVLGGLGGAVAGGGVDAFDGLLMTLVNLGFGITFLVMRNNHDVQAAFQGAAEAPPAVEGVS